MNQSVVEKLLSFVKAYKAVVMFVTCLIVIYVRGALCMVAGLCQECSQMKEETFNEKAFQCTSFQKNLFNVNSYKPTIL